MHINSERGSGDIVWIGLIGLVVLAAILMFGMAANSTGMAEGAETIAEAIIDNNSVVDDGLYMTWKGRQTIMPNRHAIERHGADAWAATDCYNRNGAFHIMSINNHEFHLLCRDDDNSVRDVIIKRRGNSNEFEFVNAFTPKDGVWRDVMNWLTRKNAGKAVMPQDAVIYVDGIAP